MDQSFLWALPVRFSPQLRCWGDECALFDSESGDTHVIDAVAASILDELASGPLSHAQIVARFTEGFTASSQAVAEQHLSALLESLEAKNLVRRVAQ